MTDLVAGLLLGLTLIVAIGAQNAFVLRQGLSRNHIGLVVAVCALSDALLILAGVGGVGVVVRDHPTVLTALRWVGAAYLLGFGVHSWWKAHRDESLRPGDTVPRSRMAVLGTTLALTYLNPHVYLDTVLMLGSVANQHGGGRWWFAVGAMLGSVLWFSALGYGAGAAARLMVRPVTWRILDVLIGVVMIALAVRLLVT